MISFADELREQKMCDTDCGPSRGTRPKREGLPTPIATRTQLLLRCLQKPISQLQVDGRRRPPLPARRRFTEDPHLHHRPRPIYGPIWVMSLAMSAACRASLQIRLSWTSEQWLGCR